MLIFAGLGNPGTRYARNRHNIGFMAVEAIATACRAAPWRVRFQGQTCEATIGNEKVLLLKPQTYMNESGRAIGEAARFFKVAPADVIVFHDELDLAPAKLRIKLGGGNAGHNGLRSTTAAIGNEYRRVRMGIGHPGDKALVHAYVLNDFGKAEEAWVEDLCSACADNAALLAAHDDAGFQNKVHLFMEARGHGAVKRLGEKAD
ncbi:MAG TPA: aminoacyl-tRNA hydrolase [Bosea sp. (in: a-proteobacteria)]|jgi:PTH1 family peptidyl-tRNA hydrolase|uniref:aminoacyl-tRNA hydrolase n=1 Tax=Bosea sp. (in: a-proteobacteria) TaxID=1871050 RepID=UPI002E139D85|nr:aminoacyl-tRNA hydrolase [Bosea sp. (in: a-proteobacteria)]